MTSRPTVSRGPGLARAVLTLVAIALLGVCSAGPAWADVHPTAVAAAAGASIDDAAASVTELENRLAESQDAARRLEIEAEQAVDAYDEVMVRLDRARADAAAAASASARAATEVATARADLGRWAAAAYRSGGPMASWSAVLSSTGARDLLRRSATLRAAGQARAADLLRARVAEDLAHQAQLHSAAALALVAAETEAAERARAEVQSRLTRQDAETAALAAEQTELLAALAAARETDQHLELARLAERDAALAHASVDSAFSRGLPPPGLVAPHSTGAGARRAVLFALAQVGRPYLWAAAGPDAFDCSGLTMAAWAHGQVRLDHWSVGQAQQAPPVPIADARPGDLVFFAADVTDVTTIYHVGLYIGDGMMVEAPHPGATVRVASIWRPGLFGAARP